MCACDCICGDMCNYLCNYLCKCAEKPACSEEAAGIAAPAELPGPTAVVAEGNQGCSTAKVLVGVPGGG